MSITTNNTINPAMNIDKKEAYKKPLLEFLKEVKSPNSWVKRDKFNVGVDVNTGELVWVPSPKPMEILFTKSVDFNRITNEVILDAYDRYTKPEYLSDNIENEGLFTSLLDYVFRTLKSKLKKSIADYNKALMQNKTPANGEFIKSDFNSSEWLRLYAEFLSVNNGKPSSYDKRGTKNLIDATKELILDHQVVLSESIEDIGRIARYMTHYIRVISDEAETLYDVILNKLADEYPSMGDKSIEAVEEVIKQLSSRSNNRNIKNEIVHPRTWHRLSEIIGESDYTIDPELTVFFDLGNVLYQLNLKNLLSIWSINFGDSDILVTNDNTSPIDIMTLLSMIELSDYNQGVILNLSKLTKRYQLSFVDKNISLSHDLINHVRDFVQQVIIMYPDDKRIELIEKLKLVESLSTSIDISQYSYVKRLTDK